jgi:hypothetical protein
MLGNVPPNTPVDLFCLYPAFCYCAKMAAGTPSAALKGEDGLDVREWSAGCPHGLNSWNATLSLTAEWEERETCLCREPTRRTRARATNAAEACHSSICGGETLNRETTRTRARLASACSAQHLVLKTAFVINKGEVPREFGQLMAKCHSAVGQDATRDIDEFFQMFLC